jgi:hypothetical protein
MCEESSFFELRFSLAILVIYFLDDFLLRIECRFLRKLRRFDRRRLVVRLYPPGVDMLLVACCIDVSAVDGFTASSAGCIDAFVDGLDELN